MNASLSAPSTRNAPQTWHVSHRSAKTLVLVFVAPTPHAQSGITIQTVSVILGLKEMLSKPATEKQHVRFKIPCHMEIFKFTFLAPPVSTIYVDPCNPSPCGSNAVCETRNRGGSCRCIPEYFGDPYVACRPECVVHSDCPSNKACQRNKCVDPCPGTCGVNARCSVKNHVPVCTCIDGYIGDPFTSCRLKPRRKMTFMYSIFCMTS